MAYYVLLAFFSSFTYVTVCHLLSYINDSSKRASFMFHFDNSLMHMSTNKRDDTPEKLTLIYEYKQRTRNLIAYK